MATQVMSGKVAVQATVKAGVKIQDFDFYFDFVLDLVATIRSGRNSEQPPR